MKTSWIWPTVIFALFCLPLFIGLGNTDLFGDEAIYAWGADRILETGEWLVPKSSPYPDRPFLEKPPLKFWILAAGIQAGLPHDESGMRFWDALMGGVALLYVFGIGRRLGGAACGAVAAMILFVHKPLVFDGLRSNMMEASLILSYCGGMFHYLGWIAARDNRRLQWGHAIMVALYFTLGFMVKFVAALFLPMVLGVASLVVGSYRTRVVREWRTWLGASLLALAGIAPWFVYCTVIFGRQFWLVIFGSHIYTRLTASLDPAHVHPWNHYFVELVAALNQSGVIWIVAAGAILLVADTIRRRRPEGLVVILWFVLPLAVISLGTSKLYHYAFPFLPPVALAGGFTASFLWDVVRPRVVQAASVAVRLIGGVSIADLLAHRPAVRRTLMAMSVVSAVVVVWTLVAGSLVIKLDGTTIFQNRHLLRPGALAAVLAILGAWPEGAAGIGVVVLTVALLPVPAYRETLQRFTDGTRLLRPLSNCVARVGARPDMMAQGPRGMYVDGNGPNYENPFNHQYRVLFQKCESVEACSRHAASSDGRVPVRCRRRASAPDRRDPIP